MKKAVLLVFVVISILLTSKVFAQNVSNEGTDFWAVFPTHVPSGGSLANIAVFVTSKFDSEVTVSCGTWSQILPIPANTAVQFDVPRENAYINFSESNVNLLNRGIHIKVTDGKPKVSAYTHIYGNARSAASLILPYETLGQTYYSMNYTQSNGGNNYLAIVAVEDNTTVLLHEKSGATKTITLLKAGDVYEYISGSADLTGVFVETDPSTSSCKRFAAFSGTSVVTIACSGSQDPLYQQLYPTVSWGKNYGVVPFINRKYILRILAQEDNTKVNYNGQTYTVNKGTFIESGQLTESTFISADKLISVAQYSLTQACSSVSGGLIIGDPEMVMLNPIEFNIKGVTVFSSPLQNIAERYLNILIRANKTATFKINGVAPVVNWNTLSGNTAYAYAQIPVTDLSLTLTADDGFNAIAYGFGQAESYSYSAGTNLSSNNYLTVVNEAKNEESPNGCIGQQVDFKVNLPYQPDKITWKLDGQPELISPSLIPEVKIVNGQTIYVYRYPAKKTYTVAGEYHLNVIAHVPDNAVNCQNGDLETNYVFTIYDLPTVAFDVAATSCAKSDILFTDKSASNAVDFAITEWLWDFGDGKKSNEQNPKHQYAAEGNYTVSLVVKSGTGCSSNALQKPVKIFPLPVSLFSSASNTCINTDYLVKDESTISSLQTSNKIVKWSWDLGDGTKIDKIDGAPFSYKFASPGVFTISLVTTSAEGCVSIAFTKNVTVTNLPIADFSLPDVCLTDVFALFVNKSVDVTGGTDFFKYEWDFGDVAANATNPNTSTDKDGKHRYIESGEYTVTLKITNINGCITSRTQKFIVNGAVEKAGFTVQNENNLCSNQDVVINNTSTILIGRITKILIYQDYLNAPEVFQTIVYPTGDNIHLTYPVFGGNADKNFTIHLVAYSGETCKDSTSQIITLKPSPILEFADIPSVCQNDGSVIINQAKETFGIIGKYSGKGVDADGNFNPRVAGVGQHEITYTVNAANGCADSIKNVITVYESPTADMGATLYILAGGEVKIPAVAQGSGLIYKWSPSIGLDHDDVLNPIASPQKDTNYLLLVTTNEGCTTTTSVTVKVLQALIPPNSFTPNGDGVNDFWNIKYLDSYPKATIEVFNRNGGRVFFSNGYKIPFDGSYQNGPLPVGVYYYIINPRNGRKTVTGPLTIIR
ncbi:PKD domain-containing protein [Pedobacter jamesrossensis]|uniref:PKD domain-containing protein n=1 Tax=Pedobacter jamesrossensis TaxID=1908238 RepID=A0ABV8NRY1_9SPHI